jgi:hypothetical protein
MELKGFTKLNEATAPELLKDEELTKLEDCVLDEKLGRPCKRGGWERVGNYADVTSNISSLHEVVTSNGSNYLLAGINGKLRKSLSGTGTFSDVTDKGTPPYRMQAYADTFIFTDGSAVPFIVSGASLGTTDNLEISAPDISAVESGFSTTGNDALTLDSHYKWLMVYVTEKGDKSRPSQPFTHHFLTNTSFTTLTPNNVIGFKNLPVSSDSRVTARHIYRTLANGDVFYFHSQLDNVITEWFDDLPDSYLGSENFDYLNCPQTAEYVSLHKERIIFGNISRTVKNWIQPCHSKGASMDFTVTMGSTGYTLSSKGTGGYQNSLAQTDGSGTLSGSYVYRVVFFDKEGLMSDPMDTPAIQVDSPNDSININKLPIVDTSFEYISNANIYRSTDGGDFKLVYQYNPRRGVTDAVWYPAGLTDTGWADGTDYVTNQTTETEKCGMAFSEIAQPATFRLEDIRNIFPDDGDEITGIYDDQDGILVFKTRSICKIYTNGSPDNWRLVKLVTNIGCSEPNALIKYGNDYVFVSNGEIYKYNSSKGYENIGIEIWNSLDGITAWHSSMADDGWYMFGVSGGMTKGYGFLVYDYIVGSWYIFNINGIPYASLKDNNGNLLVSQGAYVCKYGYGTTDTETGSPADIVPILRTKTFGEAIALVRLRKLKFNYKKMDNETLTITITNPDTGVVNTYTDTTNSTNTSDFKLYESPVKATDSLKETPKFYVNFTGAGFVEWSDFKLVLKPILKGMRENG